MENVLDMAAAMEALAGWMKDEQAAGRRADWIVQQAGFSLLFIARSAREAAALQAAPDRAA